MGKHFLIIEERLSKFKNYCIQLSFFRPYFFYNIVNTQFRIWDDRYYFIFLFTLFGSLLSIDIHWSKETDHAGFMFEITILGLYFSVSTYDIRHWDDDNECWESRPPEEQETIS